MLSKPYKPKVNYQTYIHSIKWAKKRAKILKRDGYKCKLCKQPGNHVHHITYQRLGHEWLADLMTVCQRCHKYIHNPSHLKNKKLASKKVLTKSKK